MNLGNIKKLNKHWWLIALILIFLFSYYIRSINIVPDRVLSFDPVFQYRFTYYFANWYHLPVWDELTYYVGRAVDPSLVSPFMFYITSIVFWIVKGFGFTLKTVASYMSAVYGAAIIIPAFLIGRELSNKYGGLLTATLIGTAPQILIRTFGSSYDTDQLALFFIVLTLYLGVYALRKKTIASLCLAIIGFSAAIVAWGLVTYTFIILSFFVVVYFVLSCLIGEKTWIIKNEKTNIKLGFSEKLKLSLKKLKKEIILLMGLIGSLIIFGFINKVSPLGSIFSIIGFATKAEAWIVNISIAELQPFNIFSLQGWTSAMGGFAIGDNVISSLVLIVITLLIVFGFVISYKKNLRVLSFLLTLFLIGIYTTFRGIRFTEFTSALFIILIGTGFGYFVSYCKREKFLEIFSLGLGLCIVFFALFLSLQMGQSLGPDINSNWDDAWNFLKTQTPEFSIVGTWWDPGHMITGLAERRAYADGAHCGDACMYTINDRITDLGKIFNVKNEKDALPLLKKYQGTSPKIYWIASDDLIGKFQWLQYFGTGCDARSDQTCPLYYQIGRQSVSYALNGTIPILNYGNINILPITTPIPIYIQEGQGALISEVIYYDRNGNVNSVTFSEPESMIEMLKPLETDLNIKFINQTISFTIWIQKDYSYIAIIPQTLRNVLFTEMFFLEGKNLNHFRQVFRNEQVKIYEVIF